MSNVGLSRPRVGILGARRLHQGLGPFYATCLERAGAEVRAFAVRTAASLRSAAEDLAARCGRPVDGHVGIDALLARDDLDAVVIATPIAAHEPALRGALARGLHVLCEKPLLEPEPGAAERADAIARGFAERGLHLLVNAQWPLTLRAYFELFPGLHDAPVESFWMLLSPASHGRRTMADALPHPLSLLQALMPCPTPEIRDARIEIGDREATRHDVRFRYLAGDRDVACRIELVRAPDPPRPAGYGINGHRAMRRIEPDGYRMFLDGPGGSVPVPDPLQLSVDRFVSRLRAGPPGPEIDVSVADRVRMLVGLVSEYPGPREGVGADEQP